jgi:hypothetical protein
MEMKSSTSGGNGLREQAEALLTLTRSMAAAADVQKWDAVAELEGQRRAIISEIFGSSFFQKDFQQEAGRLAACLREVLTFDRRIIDQGETGLRELTEKLAGFGQSRRAQDAYQDASAD